MRSYETPMDTFEYVPFTHPMVKEGHQQIKRIAEEMEDALVNSISSPRHLAIALTRLEEVMMWAGKGFANDQKEINKLTEERAEDYTTPSEF